MSYHYRDEIDSRLPSEILEVNSISSQTMSTFTSGSMFSSGPVDHNSDVLRNVIEQENRNANTRTKYSSDGYNAPQSSYGNEKRIERAQHNQLVNAPYTDRKSTPIRRGRTEVDKENQHANLQSNHSYVLDQRARNKYANPEYDKEMERVLVDQYPSRRQVIEKSTPSRMDKMYNASTPVVKVRDHAQSHQRHHSRGRTVTESDPNSRSQSQRRKPRNSTPDRRNQSISRARSRNSHSGVSSSRERISRGPTFSQTERPESRGQYARTSDSPSGKYRVSQHEKNSLQKIQDSVSYVSYTPSNNSTRTGRSRSISRRITSRDSSVIRGAEIMKNYLASGVPPSMQTPSFCSLAESSLSNSISTSRSDLMTTNANNPLEDLNDLEHKLKNQYEASINTSASIEDIRERRRRKQIEEVILQDNMNKNLQEYMIMREKQQLELQRREIEKDREQLRKEQEKLEYLRSTDGSFETLRPNNSNSSDFTLKNEKPKKSPFLSRFSSPLRFTSPLRRHTATQADGGKQNNVLQTIRKKLNNLTPLRNRGRTPSPQRFAGTVDQTSILPSSDHTLISDRSSSRDEIQQRRRSEHFDHPILSSRLSSHVRHRSPSIDKRQQPSQYDKYLEQSNRKSRPPSRVRHRSPSPGKRQQHEHNEYLEHPNRGMRSSSRVRHRSPSSDKRNQSEHITRTRRMSPSPFEKSRNDIVRQFDSKSEEIKSSEMFRTTVDSGLENDPGYRHAQKSGILWQTIVGEFVRFPTKWFAHGRTPLMGLPLDESASWKYVARFLVRGNPNLDSVVSSRNKPGRLLLHIVVRDTASWCVSQDIAIGCFHPQADGVKDKLPHDNNSSLVDIDARVVWMAVRRTENHEPNVLIDDFLFQGMGIEQISYSSPLGERRYINNSNVRAVSDCN